MTTILERAAAALFRVEGLEASPTVPWDIPRSRAHRVLDALERHLGLPSAERGEPHGTPLEERLRLVEEKLGPAPEGKADDGLRSYELGNILRGFYSDRFASDDEAWTALGERFDRGFPSANGRSVMLRKTVRSGVTKGGNAAPDPFYANLKAALEEKGGELVRIDPVFGKER